MANGKVKRGRPALFGKEDVQNIRKMHKGGASRKELASQFSSSYATISSVLKGSGPYSK